VINNKNAPTHKIAKKLNILKQQLQLENQYNTQNLENLAHNITTTKTKENLRMVTFDIKDLYVNIPIEERLKITEQQLLKTNNKQKKKQVITILHTILKQNYFEYQDKIYHPSKGVAMGSPISGIIAEIFLQHTENRHIKQLLDSKIITFYTRYVDDIFIIYDTNRMTTDEMQTYIKT
jgi:NADH:ubiquinone oxidoreductase subunit E